MRLRIKRRDELAKDQESVPVMPPNAASVSL